MQFLARRLPILALAALFSHIGVTTASAQYFGQNKVQYRTFDFEVLETERFDIYYYPEEAEAVADAARLAERWYTRLSEVFDHELSSRQPLILYASSPHFQQTNVVEGLLGEGTGGVTESLKRRVVMPFANGLGATDHVLGHEMVHAFQYDILGPAMGLPLWFVEGMAEYLSLGTVDAHTAVWVRDAALAEELPTIEDLYSFRYFPYRWGHAFWAYVGGRYGDGAIAEIVQLVAGPAGGPAARKSMDPVAAIEQVLGADSEALSAEWHASIARTMVIEDRRRGDGGDPLFVPGDDRTLNVAPVLSPDGTRMALLSSRDLLSIDIFLADARTGEIQRKLTSTAADPHFDSLQFIDSAGTWSPDGRRFAFTALSAGRPVLVIVDAESGDHEAELELPGVDEALQPAWSPDGSTIAFSGLAGGYNDLFLVTLADGAVRRLTRDAFADLHPAWSPDGGSLVFTTDRYSTDIRAMRFGLQELARYDVAANRVRPFFAFEGASHVAPQWTTDGRVLFVADPDGVPDVYRLDPATNDVRRLTLSRTGVTGITPQSPPLAASRDGSLLAFLLYRDFGYEIRTLRPQASGTLAAPGRTTRAAARLAPARPQGTGVDRLLAAPLAGLPAAAPTQSAPYDADLSLDYIGQQFGVATTNRLGSYLGGGISVQFSDMLGNHVVQGVAQVNGGADDLGGRVGYLNRTRRWNWGGWFQYVPYVTGGFAQGVTEVDGRTVLVEQELLDRQVERHVNGVLEYPFSRASRFELGAGVRHLTFERELNTRAFDFVTGQQLLDESQTTDLSDPVTLGEGVLAFARDTAVFGATSPILGHRSRVEAAPAFGSLQFTTLIADARQYVMPFRPLTIAARGLFIGRLGSDGESPRLSPLFIGYPNLVRGYDVNSFSIDECGPDPTRCDLLENLLGSRMIVGGVEARVPLLGAFTGEIDYGPLPAELIAFFDAGVAWTADSRPDGFGGANTRPWARSAGVGVRINALGYVILELDAVRALDRPDDGWRFVFGVRPGF